MEKVLLSNNFSHSQKKASAARKMVSRVHDSFFFFTWTSIKGHKAPIARKHFSRKRSRFTHPSLPQHYGNKKNLEKKGTPEDVSFLWWKKIPAKYSHEGQPNLFFPARFSN